MKYVISEKVFSHYFKIDNRLKRPEIGVKEMFERKFDIYFSEVKQLQLNITGNNEEICKEGNKFPQILKTGTKKKGNHYEIPFSFRDTDVRLPNNRNHGIKKMNQLKRRWQKDSKFFEDYKMNMGARLEKKVCKKIRTKSK